jgi:hypothetical protein
VTWSVCTEDMTKSWELSNKLRKNYPLLRCLFDQYVLQNPPTQALQNIVTKDHITNSDNRIQYPVASVPHSHSALDPEQSVINTNCGNNDKDTPNVTSNNTIHPIHPTGAADGPPLMYNNPGPSLQAFFFFFFVFNQQFIMRCSNAVRRPIIQTVRTLRLRYALPVITQPDASGPPSGGQTQAKTHEYSKTMSPFRAMKKSRPPHLGLRTQ